MTMIVSIFGFAGRIAGDLLTTALGWASSLLFGRVPRSHQIYLVLMMGWSFVWIIVLLGLLIPTIASVLLAATPHPPFIDRAWLGLALTIGAIFIPLGVGLAGYLVPAEGERPHGFAVLREILRGYLLAPLISSLLVFLSIVGIARKIRSKRHGWSDTHVAIVVKPHGYDQLVGDLRDALTSADLAVREEEAPWVLTMPARLITRVAGPNVRKLRPDRLMNLVTPDLRIGVYPSDIAVSGPTRERTRARAAILSRLVTTSAHLTTSAESQEVEDLIERLARAGGPVTASSPDVTRAEFRPIDDRLLELAVPTDEWDILYRLRVQVERDLLAGSAPGTAFPGHRPEVHGTVAAHDSGAVEPASSGPGGEWRARRSGDVTSERQAPDHAIGQHDPATRDQTARRYDGRHGTVAWLIVAILSLVGFVALTIALASKVVFAFDTPLLDYFHSWDGTPIVWKAISETANIPLIVIGIGLIVWLFLTKRKREALLVLLMLAAVTAGSEGVKQLVGRPRPETGTADGIPGVVYSYPSGHVLEALTILGFVALRIWRNVLSIAVRVVVVAAVAVDVVLVGIARMALNAHYPTDVLAGFLGAVGALGLYAWLTRPGAWADPHRADAKRAT
jgi:undecaprenyl-diphosphatase